MDLSHSFGFWKEFYSNRYERPSIFNDIKNISVLQDKGKILSYLTSGVSIVGMRHLVSCPIYKDRIRGNSIITDGLWFWSSMAIHYVEKYDIAIPLAFIEHIRNNKFQCPYIDEADDVLCDTLYERSFELS